MRRSCESYESKQQYKAMYSSCFGGITTDPAAMVIPMDDHMVHRGHGVFDTAAIVDGLVTFALEDSSLIYLCVKLQSPTKFSC